MAFLNRTHYTRTYLIAACGIYAAQGKKVKMSNKPARVDCVRCQRNRLYREAAERLNIVRKSK